jgi:hypothetical protein
MAYLIFIRFKTCHSPAFSRACTISSFQFVDLERMRSEDDSKCVKADIVPKLLPRMNIVSTNAVS